MAQRPDLEELRAVAQPPEHLARYSAEHWAGSYLRRLSLPLTRFLVGTPITANGVTWSMIPVGLLGAAAIPITGIWGPLIAVVAMQLQILLDCSDGEVARWRQTFSPAGIYLDRIGHYVTEAAIPIGLGLRADDIGPGHWQPGGWTTWGLVIAVLVLLNKSFTDLVHMARHKTGRPPVPDAAATARSRRSGLARVRSAMRYLPIFRATISIEASLLALVAGIGDVVSGGRGGTQILVAVLVPLAAITAVGHLAGVLSSSRLR
jgi:phosphatidylglycerophosphate synthase